MESHPDSVNLSFAFDDLPLEIQYKVLSFLSYDELSQARSVGVFFRFMFFYENVHGPKFKLTMMNFIIKIVVIFLKNILS